MALACQLFLFPEIETKETSFFGHEGVERSRQTYEIELGR